MVSTILLKRSSTEGNRPTDSDLSLGELAINTHDGVIFFEQNKDGAISIREVENTIKAENVFYVSKSGNDNNDGTSLSKAFLTIDKAVEEAAKRRGALGLDSDGAEGSVIRTKSARDLGDYLTGARFDILLNSNFNRAFYGRAGSYTKGWEEVITSLTHFKGQVSTLIGSYGTAETRSNAYFDELIDIITNGKNNTDADNDDSLETADFPIPVTAYYNDGAGAESNAQRVRDILVANRAFIAEEVNQYSKVTYPDVTYDEEKCKRDVRYAIDAITYDAVYFGNAGTYENAKFFHYDGKQIPDDQKAATVDAYNRLKTVIGEVLNNTTVTLSNSGAMTTTQNTALPAPTSDKITTVQSLVDIIKNVINSGTSALPTKITPETSASVDTAVLGAAITTPVDLIETNRTTLINANLDYIETVYPLLFGIGDRYQDILDEPEVATTIYVKTGDYTITNPIELPKNTSLIGDNLKNCSIRPKNKTSDMIYVNNNCYITGFTFRDHLQPAAAIAWDPTGTPETNIIVNSPYIQNCSSITGPDLSRDADGGYTYDDGTGNPLSGGDGIRNDGSKVGGIRSIVVDSFTQINQGGKGVYILNRGYCQLVSVFTVYCDVGVLCETGGFGSITNSNCTFGNVGLKATGVSDSLYGGYIDGQQDRLDNILTLKGLTQRPNITDCVKFGSDPIYYTVDSAAWDSDTGTGTIRTLEDLELNLPDSDGVSFFQRSALSASSHTFEWVGTGTDVRTSFPFRGGIPIQANEVEQDANKAGLVFITSTDQKGDFRVGEDFLIQRSTGTIEGDAFDRSLFARVTPFSLALED